MINFLKNRWFYLGEALSLALLLGFAYYLLYFKDLPPCVLCEVQRLIFSCIAVLVFGIFLLNRWKWVSLLLLAATIFFSSVGILFAARQTWIQFLPIMDGPSSCGASIYYLLQIMPWWDAFNTVLLGGPECSEVHWQFLGLSMAAWALIWFTGFFVISIIQFLLRLLRK